MSLCVRSVPTLVDKNDVAGLETEVRGLALADVFDGDLEALFLALNQAGDESSVLVGKITESARQGDHLDNAHTVLKGKGASLRHQTP